MPQKIMWQKNKLHILRCWGVSSSVHEFGVVEDIIRPVQMLVTLPWWLSGKEFACQCPRRVPRGVVGDGEEDRIKEWTLHV